MGGWQKKEKSKRERMKNILEIEEQEQKGNERGDRECVRQKATERRTHRGGRVRNRERKGSAWV